MSDRSRHPKALPYLFLTEMWERFGFYTVQGMLVLFMTRAFGFSDDKSYTVAGMFTSLAYLAPMIGGLIADRLLGFRLSIILGGIFLSLGYATLAIMVRPFFYVGLGIVIVGNGLFKPNISSLLGTLYRSGDTARESGFTLFYMGINIGVLLSGASGTIQGYFGWHVVFALASLGLLIGLAIFLKGIRSGNLHYSNAHLVKNPNRFLKKPWIIFYCVFAVLFSSFLLRDTLFGKWLLPVTGVALLCFMFFLAFREDGEDRRGILSLNALIISSVIFWMLLWQIFFSVNLFIDRLVDKKMFGIEVPTTWFYTLESIFIILLGPFLAWSWTTLNRSQKNPSPFSKFILAIFFVGSGFMLLTVSTFFTNTHHLVSPWWIFVSYFLMTVGELLLSPTGLAAVTSLSPARLTGMMMGIWFAALGFGGQFGGWLAKFSSIPDTVRDVLLQLPVYRAAFFDYTCIAWGVCIILFFLQSLVRSRES
ncbi:MAG TPA: peptide MFS transporter [Gammaproteobacteria bacterium]|nr:peptide MFS transporter [Gammaproteobacteria bacterium]